MNDYKENQGIPMMQTFKQYTRLFEASDKMVKANASNNDRGVMHELLVGRHLNGGKHMPHHPNKEGRSATEEHDHIKAKMSTSDYKAAVKKANVKAKKLEGHLGKIKKVSWTSKSGDIEKSTGVKSSQKEDSGDIVVTSHRGPHTSISLKVTKGPTPNITTANLGKSQHHKNSGKHHKEMIADIKKKHPEIAKMSKADQNEWVKNNPKKHEEVKNVFKKTLSSHAKAHGDELNHHLKHGGKKGADHVKHYISGLLHAHETPLEKNGHSHMRATITVHNGKDKAHIIRPHEHYKHVMKDPDFHKNIKITHSGGNVHFHHKGKKIASLTYKMGSQSRPTYGTSLVVIGKPNHNMKDGEISDH